MTHYARGRAFEYRVRGELERAGYWVLRSAGSKGAVDLVALRAGEVLLVQCKCGQRGIPVQEWNELHAVARAIRARPILATRKARKIVWEELNGQRAPGDRSRPSWHWTPPPASAEPPEAS